MSMRVDERWKKQQIRTIDTWIRWLFLRYCDDHKAIKLDKRRRE